MIVIILILGWVSVICNWWFRYEIGKLYHRYVERDVVFDPWCVFDKFAFLWLFKRIDYRQLLADYPRDGALPGQIRLVKRLKWVTLIVFSVTMILISIQTALQ